jgi:hypothetical protein
MRVIHVGLRVVLGVGIAAAVSAVGVTLAAGERSGPAVIVDTTASAPLMRGDSTTEFTLRLPAGATCPGDSANDDWRVQSFVVPAAVDPGTLRYGPVRPDGDGHYTLHRPDTKAFVHVLTGPNSGPGEPGMVMPPPPFSFAMFPPGTLADGDHRIGLACSLAGETARYWDTRIAVTSDPTVQPGEFRWSVLDTPDASIVAAADGETPSSSSAAAQLLILVVLVGALAATYELLRRRRSTEFRSGRAVDAPAILVSDTALDDTALDDTALDEISTERR